MSAPKINSSMFLKPLDLPPSAWTGHIPFAAWVMEELRPAVFVELGTHAGASYLAFCQAVRESSLPTQCFAVDTWQGDEHAGRYGEEVYETLRAMHDPRYAGFSQLLRTTFDEALLGFADGSIDLLHIDGLHTYDAVRHDFESWLPKMSARGVVLFHDTVVREREFGVWKLWEEVAARYPSFEFQHSHGLGVLLVGESIPEPLRALAELKGSERTVTRRLFEALADGLRTDPVAEAVQAHVLAHLRNELAAAQAQIADANQQLGKADAFAKTQAGHVERLKQEIADREERIAHLNGQLADRQAELATAHEHLLAADQNARAHVAASALVQRDIQDLQRHIAAQQEALERAQAAAAAPTDELDAARARIAELEAEQATAMEEARRELEAERARFEQLASEMAAARQSIDELARQVAEHAAASHATAESIARLASSRRWPWSAPLGASAGDRGSDAR